MKSNIPIFILAGGKGIRFAEKTQEIPKPLIEIGDKTILEHIMSCYQVSGFDRFIVCTGYRSKEFKKYFLEKIMIDGDVIFDLYSNEKGSWTPGELKTPNSGKTHMTANITIAFTGETTQTGGRIFEATKNHLTEEDDIFMCTYGDAVSDIDINKLLDYHKQHKRLATVTVVNTRNNYGIVQVDLDGNVIKMEEKPKNVSYVNGGFFVFSRKALDYFSPNCILEVDVLPKLAELNQLAAYKHEGYWQNMDNLKEYEILQEDWKNGKWPLKENDDPKEPQ